MKADKIATISNVLTMMRIILSPVVVLALLCDHIGFAFIVFVIAALTDLFDGYLARLLDEQTHLGVFLDPIADKIFIISSLMVLVFTKTPLLQLPLWFFWLLLIRECMVIVGSIVLYCMGIQRSVEPSFIGKLSAALQMIFIGWLFIQYLFVYTYVWINDYIVIILIALSFISLVQYCIRGFCVYAKR